MPGVLIEYGECVQTKSLYKCETSICFSKNNTVSICIYTQFIISLYQQVKIHFFLQNVKGRELPTQTVASSEHVQEDNSS